MSGVAGRDRGGQHVVLILLVQATGLLIVES